MWTKLFNSAVFSFVILALAGCNATEPDKASIVSFYVKGQHKYCAVHHMRLQEGTAPIIYGLPYISEEYQEASKEFPNSISRVFGGCMASLDSPKTEEVLYCPACREAEAKWIAAKQTAHKKDLLRRARKAPDINVKGKHGYTLLDEAAFHGHIDVVKELIGRGADINARDAYGRTALHWATEADHREIVQLLIGAGADVNICDAYGRTPLHDAAWFASKSVVSLLVESGAEINAEDNDGTGPGTTPLRFARAFNTSHPDVASYLEKRGGVNDPAFIRRIEQTVDINKKGEDGRTLLHEAASEGYYTAVKKLIAKGSDINARDDFGATPLHESVWGQNIGVMELLVDSGADINAKNEEGRTPLHKAAEQEFLREVLFLINAGADLDERDELGDTPLHSPARSGDVRIIKLLIDAGADVNVKNIFGETPLHRARAEVVKLLIDAGADVNTKDDSGETPLHKSARSCHVAIVKLLIEAGADVNARDDVDQTPLTLAKKCRCKDVAEFLCEYETKKKLEQ